MKSNKMGTTENNVHDLMSWAKKVLEQSKVPSAIKDAEALFMHSFDMRREDVFISAGFRPSYGRIALFRQYVKLRAARFPLQYIVENVEFMGLDFTLERGVFIPRPETELLVAKALESIELLGKKRVNILDIGTGCGSIAISLTKRAAGCKIIASDISDKALRIAAGNARRHGVRKNIKFVKSSFFDKISAIYYNYFDIIVSNPPYVRSAELEELEPEISYEDERTLDGGRDGLRAHKRIINGSARFLKKNGFLIFEIGCGQKADIEELIKKDGRFSDTAAFRDYNKYDRIVLARYRKGNK